MYAACVVTALGLVQTSDALPAADQAKTPAVCVGMSIDEVVKVLGGPGHFTFTPFGTPRYKTSSVIYPSAGILVTYELLTYTVIQVQPAEPPKGGVRPSLSPLPPGVKPVELPPRPVAPTHPPKQ